MDHATGHGGVAAPAAGGPIGPAPRSQWLLVLLLTPLLRLAVARLAVPPGMPPRTSCPGCGAALAWASAARTALLPPGRCGRCFLRLGAPPYLLEVFTAVAAAVMVAAATSPWVLAAGLWWTAFAVPLVFIDLRVHRLPDVLTLPAACGTLGLLAAAALAEHRWHLWLQAAAAAAVSGLVFLLVSVLCGDRGLGLGDAKLVLSVAGVLGWFGWGAVVGGLFLGFLASAIVGVALIATRRAAMSTHLPLGPFLAGGPLAMLALIAAVT